MQVLIVTICILASFIRSGYVRAETLSSMLSEMEWTSSRISAVRPDILKPVPDLVGPLLYQAGNEYFRQNRFNSARYYYESFLLTPNMTKNGYHNATRNLAIIAFHKKRWVDAFWLFRNYFSSLILNKNIDFDVKQDIRKFAVVAFHVAPQKKYGDAIESILTVLEVSHFPQNIWYPLFPALMYHGGTSSIRSQYESLIASGQNSSETLFLRGVLAAMLGKYEESKKNLIELSTAENTKFMPHIQILLARIALAQHQFKAALLHYDSVSNPNESILHEKIIALFFAKKYSKAAEILKNNPQISSNTLNKAFIPVIFAYAGDFDNSKKLSEIYLDAARSNLNVISSNANKSLGKRFWKNFASLKLVARSDPYLTEIFSKIHRINDRIESLNDYSINTVWVESLSTKSGSHKGIYLSVDTMDYLLNTMDTLTQKSFLIDYNNIHSFLTKKNKSKIEDLNQVRLQMQSSIEQRFKGLSKLDNDILSINVQEKIRRIAPKFIELARGLDRNTQFKMPAQALLSKYIHLQLEANIAAEIFAVDSELGCQRLQKYVDLHHVDVKKIKVLNTITDSSNQNAAVLSEIKERSSFWKRWEDIYDTVVIDRVNTLCSQLKSSHRNNGIFWRNKMKSIADSRVRLNKQILDLNDTLSRYKSVFIGDLTRHYRQQIALLSNLQASMAVISANRKDPQLLEAHLRVSVERDMLDIYSKFLAERIIYTWPDSNL